MVGIYAEHSSTFLRVVAILTLLGFAIPISVAPLRWARSFRWSVDAQPNLALYFGRCLGVMALVMTWAAWHAADHPVLQPFYFRMFIGTAVLLTLVHIVGAVQKVQPWSETAEILFWGGLAVLGLLFYPMS
jgi:hypothetical protein